MFQNVTKNIIKDTSTIVQTAAASKIESIKDNLQSTAKGVTSDAVNTLTSNISSVSQDIISKGLNSANVFSLSIGDLAKSFKSTTEIFKNNNLYKDTVVNNVKERLAVSQNQSENKFEKMTSGLNQLGEAIQSPVAFVTSTSKAGVDSIELKSAGKGLLDKIKSIGKGTLSKITELAGGAISSVTKLVTTVPKQIIGTITNFTSNGNQILQDIKNSTVISAISSVSNNTKTVLSDISTIVNTPNKLLQDAVNILPKQVLDIIDVSGTKFPTIEESLQKIINKAPSLNDINTLKEIMSKGIVTEQITDSSGNSIKGLSSPSTSLNELMLLFNVGSEICPNVEKPEDVLDYGTNKDIYDILISKAIDAESSTLLKMLLECPKYEDIRTQTIISGKLEKILGSGNALLADIAQSYIGKSSIPDPTKAVKTLLANVPDYNANRDIISKIKSDLGVTDNDLLKDKNQAFDAESIIALSLKSKEYINDTINLDLRDTVYSVYTKYAGVA